MAPAHIQPTQPVLSCRDVEKLYGTRDNVTRALDGVSFDVAAGEYVAIMGPSGSGKTTLLNCISTIDRPTSGHILVDGQDITALRPGQLSKFRRERLGFVFQDSNLLDTLTARENIALALTINHTPAKEVTARVGGVARRLGVADVLDKFPHEMSGGQKQRVAAARAIVTDPSLVLADEPTGALDSRNSRLLLESLEELNDAGATIIMVTHDSFAASYARRALFLKDGRVWNELIRGAKTRKTFFNEIMDVVSFLGGEGADVR
ncbi:ABC transporter ATP-binding protein [Olsenella sp. An270]|uniref:ABC transporter ATP-binding protein n=1 Tax=Olsenella sp. An270 TaxID=1965615 RepID=UPI000B3B0083|nr:ABC transporter ATP-binding protein [Olsenella sp. An270]OUO60261.1 multidrug ABC transporter ATP-binding protein [Olsenella sp. An270]